MGHQIRLDVPAGWQSAARSRVFEGFTLASIKSGTLLPTKLLFPGLFTGHRDIVLHLFSGHGRRLFAFPRKCVHSIVAVQLSREPPLLLAAALVDVSTVAPLPASRLSRGCEATLFVSVIQPREARDPSYAGHRTRTICPSCTRSLALLTVITRCVSELCSGVLSYARARSSSFLRSYKTSLSIIVIEA